MTAKGAVRSPQHGVVRRGLRGFPGAARAGRPEGDAVQSRGPLRRHRASEALLALRGHLHTSPVFVVQESAVAPNPFASTLVPGQLDSEATLAPVGPHSPTIHTLQSPVMSALPTLGGDGTVAPIPVGSVRAGGHAPQTRRPGAIKTPQPAQRGWIGMAIAEPPCSLLSRSGDPSGRHRRSRQSRPVHPRAHGAQSEEAKVDPPPPEAAPSVPIETKPRPTRPSTSTATASPESTPADRSAGEQCSRSSRP